MRTCVCAVYIGLCTCIHVGAAAQPGAQSGDKAQATKTTADWIDVLGSGQLMKKVCQSLFCYIITMYAHTHTYMYMYYISGVHAYVHVLCTLLAIVYYIIVCVR